MVVAGIPGWDWNSDEIVHLAREMPSWPKDKMFSGGTMLTSISLVTALIAWVGLVPVLIIGLRLRRSPQGRSRNPSAL
jgi:hypothetical protein